MAARRTVWALALLMVAAALSPLPGALATSGELCKLLDRRICFSFDIWAGFSVSWDGVSIKWKTISPCNDAMKGWLDRISSACDCSGRLLNYASQAPALMAQGVHEAADPFTGITSPLLTGACDGGHTYYG